MKSTPLSAHSQVHIRAVVEGVIGKSGVTASDAAQIRNSRRPQRHFERGEIVAKLKKYIGRMTNNVAEYYGLIAALDYAQSNGVRALRVESDSELLVRQMRGHYKVKSPDLRPLFERAKKMSQTFESFRIDHVYREQNAEADALANEALDETSGKPKSSVTAKPEGRPKLPQDMQSAPRKLRAQVRNGGLHLLEPLDLPEDTEVEILLRPTPKS